MDEITRCLEVLGLKPGASQAETKNAYRELLMVWHPDRFASNSPLHAKAGEKVRELNAAYEFLTEHGFRDGQPILPEQPATESKMAPEGSGPEPSETSAPGSSTRIALWVLLAIVAMAGIGDWLWFELTPGPVWTPSGNARQPVLPQKSNLAPGSDLTTSNLVKPSQAAPYTDIQAATSSLPSGPFNLPAGADLLYTMRPVGGCNVMTNSEGLAISGEGNFLTRDEYRPPFVIHASAKTDLTNLRLVFGKGVVILNWEMNPAELRFHDPFSGGVTGVQGQGRIPAEEWQEVEWEVQTNFTAIRVNGQERARFDGNYGGLAELVGFHTINGVHLGVRRFEVQAMGPTNQPIDLKTGLVLYFPFDTDEKDRTTDYSGFGNHGTVQGATFVPLGRVGGALVFRGGSKSGSRVVVPHSASLVSMQRTRQFTICAWLKPNSLPEKYPVVISKGGNARPNDFGGFECLLGSSTAESVITLVSGSCGNHTGGTKGKSLATNLQQWVHLAVVVNASHRLVKFYVNGERAGDETDFGQDWRSANFALLAQLFIGGPDPAANQDRRIALGSMA